MIGRHIRDRFFQRYGMELTPDIIRQLARMASKSLRTRPDRDYPDREHVEFLWKNKCIRLVWHRETKTILTFLPERGMRLAVSRRDTPWT